MFTRRSMKLKTTLIALLLVSCAGGEEGTEGSFLPVGSTEESGENESETETRRESTTRVETETSTTTTTIPEGGDNDLPETGPGSDTPPDLPRCGLGDACCESSSSLLFCEDDLMCARNFPVGNGECLPSCGGSGEPCCATNVLGESFCDDGFSCELQGCQPVASPPSTPPAPPSTPPVPPSTPPAPPESPDAPCDEVGERCCQTLSLNYFCEGGWKCGQSSPVGIPECLPACGGLNQPCCAGAGIFATCNTGLECTFLGGCQLP